MAAIAINQQNIFMALEDGSALPLIVKSTLADPGTFSTVYEPGAGTAANVITSGDPDIVYFYGNFGSGVQVIKHTISTLTNTNKSPAGLTTKVVNGMDVNPDDANELWITVNTDQDLLKSTTGGTSWSSINAALGLNPTALKVIWPDSQKILVAGNDGTDTKLLYSTDGGVAFTNIVTVAGLTDSANIVALGIKLIDGSVL